MLFFSIHPALLLHCCGSIFAWRGRRFSNFLRSKMESEGARVGTPEGTDNNVRRPEEEKGREGERNGFLKSCALCLRGLGCAWCCQDFDAYELSHEEEFTLHVLSSAACVPYNPDDPEQEKVLLQFYDAVVNPAQSLPPEAERDWKAIGFQSQNPRTDFRGGGLLSLQQLLFFAQNFREEMLVLVEKSKRDSFPLAASLINVTHMLGTFFDLYDDHHMMTGTSTAAARASPRCLKNFTKLCVSAAKSRSRSRTVTLRTFTICSSSQLRSLHPSSADLDSTGERRPESGDDRSPSSARSGGLAKGVGASTGDSGLSLASAGVLYVFNFLFSCTVIRLDREIEKRRGWSKSSASAIDEKTPSACTWASPGEASGLAGKLARLPSESTALSGGASGNAVEAEEAHGEGEDESQPLLLGREADGEAGEVNAQSKCESEDEKGQSSGGEVSRKNRGSMADLMMHLKKPGLDLPLASRAFHSLQGGDTSPVGQRGSTIFVFADSLVACRVAVEELLSSGQVHTVEDLRKLTEVV
ncbi:ELMO/CED-12 family protein [Toxoplasma gondii VAND]|uniref:ELMO/CED-12 family protein n=1 Tax=Toxoplasma gondii VAND TaxID=933077 RepID=A0A086Q1J6_TOXGO|nr:ELMO/CED-12 family protein [Toxoplasma gondii VAND]